MEQTKYNPRSSEFWETYREKRQLYWDKEIARKNYWKSFIALTAISLMIFGILIYTLI